MISKELLTKEELNKFSKNYGLSKNIDRELITYRWNGHYYYDYAEALGCIFYWSERRCDELVELIEFNELCEEYYLVEDQATLADLLYRCKLIMYFTDGCILFDKNEIEQIYPSSSEED